MNTSTTIPLNGRSETIKNTFSRETIVGVEIQSDASIVWALLTNAVDFPRWNSTVVSLKGEIIVGSKIELKSTLDEKRTFKLRVLQMEPEKLMAWGDSQGKRVYTIIENEVGSVSFTMKERIGGFMFPLYSRFIPPFDKSFEQFAADLKKEAETISKTK